MRRMNFPEKSKINITQLWPYPPAQPSPDPCVSCPKKREPLLPSPFSLHFWQVGAKCQNPPKIQDQYFLETRAPKNLTSFSTHLRPPSPGISISRSAEPYYIECRVITQCFITKSSLPWKDSMLFRTSPKISVAAFLILPQETWIVCRQDMCCGCRQDICCVCSQDICCVSRQEICSLPRHPLGIADTGAAASRPPLCGQCSGDVLADCCRSLIC